jgi:hypothetical protein
LNAGEFCLKVLPKENQIFVIASWKAENRCFLFVGAWDMMFEFRMWHLKKYSY